MNTPRLRHVLLIVLLLFTAVFLSTIATAGAATTDLLISEYVEGSSNNKAIEIYNGTGSSVDLGAETYTLEFYFNGSTTAGTTIALIGTIADGDVFVLADNDAVLGITPDQISNSSFFNGDDAVVLKHNGVIIDVFGQIGTDPGSQWPGGGQNDTLRRQATVCSGDTNPNDAFDASVEWDIFSQDTFDGLGTHTANCNGGSTPTATPILPTPTATTPPPASNIVINEIHADPASGAPGDANGDGTRDFAQDEFVEIVNNSGFDVDISGWTLADDDTSTVFTFPANTILPDQCAAVLFGGGVPAGTFGGALVFTDDGTIGTGLSNSSDAIVLTDGTSTVATYTYGSEAGNNQSITLDPDVTGATYVQHSGATGANGALYSPGTMIDGTPFAGCPTPVEQLLLSEIVVTPTDGEFVEIYNPTGAAVDLSNVYLTDATFAGGPTYYYQIVSGGGGGGGFSDFHARFPDGASIGSGEYQTVALTGSDDFFANYGMNPTYELFEDGAGADAIADMREATPGSINDQGGLSNGGEVVILYHWDGTSSLVTDLDYVVWGDKAEAVDKTGVSTYQNDTAIADQDIVDAGGHPFGSSWQRDDLTEGTETLTGGNGAGGHDETSENLSETWCTSETLTPNAASICPSGVIITDAYIHEVQGSGLNVTAPGTVVRVEAVVVGDHQESDQLRGFFIQEEDADVDGDTMTSEGIFVYCGGCSTAVSEGDLVEVVGTQEDFFGMSQLDVIEAGVDGNVSVISSGNIGLVTPATVSLPAPASTAAEGTFEQFEGMLVTFDTELTVTEYFQLARFGQIILSEGGKLRQFTNDNLPSAAGYSAHLADIAARQIVLDDLNNTQNSTDPVYHPQPNGFSTTDYVRGGDTVTNLTGVMHWSYPGSGANTWRIRPQVTNPVTFNNANPRQAAPDPVGGNVTVATLNVLNYFTTIDEPGNVCGPSALGCRGAHSASELQRQTDKLVAALNGMNADIVGLVELENNATASLQAIVDALNVVSAKNYAYINTGTIGGDAIKVGIIYNADVVSPSGAFAVLDSNDFVDPNNTGSPRNRPALAQTFEVTNAGNASFGAKFTIVVNHLKSKGSGCGAGDDDTTTGQGNCNLTRTMAAQRLVDWLATDPTGSNDPDMMILGDINAYAMEDPIQAIIAGSDDTAGTADDYNNLINLFGGPSAYSYVFSAQWGYLDHGLANTPLTTQVTGVTEWHINADEVNLLDYNDEIQDANEQSFEAKPSANTLYAPDQYRVSDHDPLLVGLNPSPYILNGDGCIVIALEGSPFDGYATVVAAKNGRFDARDWKHEQGLPADTCFEIHGTNGKDRIYGAYADDTIFGYDGNDRLYGRDGNDALFGGPGNDYLNSNLGDFDRMYGDAGNDRLVDGDGVIAAHGGSNNDKLTITLRYGWLSPNGQFFFDGISAGYGNDTVRLTLKDQTGHYFVSISGDEYDDPPSPDEGHDVLKLRGRITPDSEFIKFERTNIR